MKKKYGYRQTSALLFPAFGSAGLGRNVTVLLYKNSDFKVTYQLNFNSGLIVFKMIDSKLLTETVLCTCGKTSKQFFDFLNTTEIIKSDWIKSFLKSHI